MLDTNKANATELEVPDRGLPVRFRKNSVGLTVVDVCELTVQMLLGDVPPGARVVRGQVVQDVAFVAVDANKNGLVDQIVVGTIGCRAQAFSPDRPCPIDGNNEPGERLAASRLIYGPLGIPRI